MKISKRENKELQKALISQFESILEDAESQFLECLNDYITGYLEDDDDFMDIGEVYFWDAVQAVYKKKAKK
jgi:hypothetical protein